MRCREVTDMDGNVFTLTEIEEKYVRAIERLEKMPCGRLSLFGSGSLSIRIDGTWYENQIITTSIFCEGGDGGDRGDRL